MKHKLILLLAFLPIAACQQPNIPQTEQQTAIKPLSDINFRTSVSSQWNTEFQILKIKPGNDYTIEPMVASGVSNLPEFNSNAIAVINAGFFDPFNQQSTSHITILSKVAADPKTNDRLTQNPKLKPYLPQIYNRSEFRRYQCSSDFKYAITVHNAVIPNNCHLIDAIGGGPQLLPKITAEEEAFVDPKTGRDAIGYLEPNARSAIGITAEGDIILIMAKQIQPSGGVNLQQLAQTLKQEGAVTALNLDGGTSSAMYFKDNLILGKQDDKSDQITRPVKSVILVKKRS